MSSQAYNTQHSAIPRPARAALPATVGPRPTKAPLSRTSQIKEGVAAEKAGTAVIQQSPEVIMAMTPANRENGVEKAALKGILKKKKIDGKVIGNGFRGRNVVSCNPDVKKANGGFAGRKRVHFAGNAMCRVYDLQPGERVPWISNVPEPQQLFKGEIGWKAWREQLESTIREERELGSEEFMARTEMELEEIRLKELADEVDTMVIQERIRQGQYDLLENEMDKYRKELEERYAAEALKDEDSTWAIYIYGGNPMIEDEGMPFSMDDPVFDEILSDMVVQEVLAKARNVQAQWEGNAPVAMNGKEAEECLTKADESAWDIALPANVSYILDEPAPFPHPDTTLDMADMAILLQDKTEWIAEETQPPVCAALEEYNVPLPNAQDLLNFERNLNDLAAEGIPISETDEDLWSRLRRGLTDMVSTKEEAFFGPPERFSFEDRFASMQDKEMLADVTFPGVVSPVLEALGADDTLLDIETGDENEWRLREYELLTEMAWSSGPGRLCAALEDGPLSGFSKTAEDRAVAAEDALAWLLSLAEVQVAVRSIDGDMVIPQSPKRNMSKESRVRYWTNHPLKTVANLRAYTTSLSVTPPRATRKLRSISRDSEVTREGEKEGEDLVPPDGTDSEDDEEMSDPHERTTNHTAPPIPHACVPPISNGIERNAFSNRDQIAFVPHEDTILRATSSHHEDHLPPLRYHGEPPLPQSPAQHHEGPPIQQNSAPNLDELASWAGHQVPHQHQYQRQPSLPINPTPLDALATWAERLPMEPRSEHVDTIQALPVGMPVENTFAPVIGQGVAVKKKRVTDLFW
ncbi:hypothetical protein NCC49_004027 [Naganishia albida]|nr:hypothetical protein NCC49_004027 [Naganishia albida]